MEERQLLPEKKCVTRSVGLSPLGSTIFSATTSAIVDYVTGRLRAACWEESDCILAASAGRLPSVRARRRTDMQTGRFKRLLGGEAQASGAADLPWSR